MKFSLDRDTFAKVLKKIDNVCTVKGSFEIMEFCMIEAVDNKITVIGMDIQNTLSITENAHVIEEGKIVIKAHHLCNTVQGQMPNAEIVLTSDVGRAKVEAGNFEAWIPTRDIAEFPTLPSPAKSLAFKVNPNALRDLISKTSFSISTDDSRNDFTGALLKVSENGQAQMVSTDGHRLSRAETNVEISGTLADAFKEKGVIIPKKGLDLASKIFVDVEGDVCIGIQKDKIIIKNDAMTHYIQRIPGDFPDFSKVIPSQLDHKAIVRREDFLQILKTASLYTAKTNTICISLSMGKLDVSAKNSVGAQMRNWIEAEYSGSGVRAGFNCQYIDEVLKAIDGEYVSLGIIDPDSPAVIRDVSTDKLDFVVMPMQLMELE